MGIERSSDSTFTIGSRSMGLAVVFTCWHRPTEAGRATNMTAATIFRRELVFILLGLRMDACDRILGCALFGYRVQRLACNRAKNDGADFGMIRPLAGHGNELLCHKIAPEADPVDSPVLPWAMQVLTGEVQGVT